MARKLYRAEITKETNSLYQISRDAENKFAFEYLNNVRKIDGRFHLTLEAAVESYIEFGKKYIDELTADLARTKTNLTLAIKLLAEVQLAEAGRTGRD